jgi:hypothetical protein
MYSVLYRNLSDFEFTLLEKLCGRIQNYNEFWNEQIHLCKVKQYDQDGSLLFIVCIEKLVEPGIGALVEGEALDSDEITIHYLLHIIDSVLTIFEVYKDDSSNVRRRPHVDEIEIYYSPLATVDKKAQK